MENITSIIFRANRGGRPRGKRGRCLTIQGDLRARAMSRARVPSPVEHEHFCAAKTHVPGTPVLDTSKQSGIADSFPSVERAGTADCPVISSSDPVHGEDVPQTVKASTATIPADIVLKGTATVRWGRRRPRKSDKRCKKERESSTSEVNETASAVSIYHVMLLRTLLVA